MPHTTIEKIYLFRIKVSFSELRKRFSKKLRENRENILMFACAQGAIIIPSTFIEAMDEMNKEAIP